MSYFTERIRELEEALRPFVEAQGAWGYGLSDSESAGWVDGFGMADEPLPLTVGDMRRAKDALGDDPDVACTTSEGLLIIHPRSTVCEVCSPTTSPEE